MRENISCLPSEEYIMNLFPNELNWVGKNNTLSSVLVQLKQTISFDDVTFLRHVVWNDLPFDSVLKSFCGPTSKKHQSPHYWPFVRGIHRWPVNSLHKGPVTRKTFPFDNVIMPSLVQIIGCYKKATNPCLNQWWPGSMTRIYVTGSESVSGYAFQNIILYNCSSLYL